MKRITSVGLVAVFVTLFAAHAAWAANNPTVGWDTGQPVAAAGQVSGSGTYTLPNPNNAGWQPNGVVVLSAFPTGGGQTFTQGGKVPANGTWAKVTIMNLPTGQYTVFATIQFKNTNGDTTNIATPTAIVNVP